MVTELHEILGTQLDTKLDASEKLINFVKWSSKQVGKDCPFYDDILFLMFARIMCDKLTSQVIDAFIDHIYTKVCGEQEDTEGLRKN